MHDQRGCFDLGDKKVVGVDVGERRPPFETRAEHPDAAKEGAVQHHTGHVGDLSTEVRL